jgi:hypothetical protein
MTEGHRWIQEQFGHLGKVARPRVGWQIDPFGLSKVYPSLFSQMCFDANAAWRISEPEMRFGFCVQTLSHACTWLKHDVLMQFLTEPICPSTSWNLFGVALIVLELHRIF